MRMKTGEDAGSLLAGDCVWRWRAGNVFNNHLKSDMSTFYLLVSSAHTNTRDEGTTNTQGWIGRGRRMFGCSVGSPLSSRYRLEQFPKILPHVRLSPGGISPPPLDILLRSRNSTTNKQWSA